MRQRQLRRSEQKIAQRCVWRGGGGFWHAWGHTDGRLGCRRFFGLVAANAVLMWFQVPCHLSAVKRLDAAAWAPSNPFSIPPCTTCSFSCRSAALAAKAAELRAEGQALAMR
jgi:hypothetical protein